MEMRYPILGIMMSGLATAAIADSGADLLLQSVGKMNADQEVSDPNQSALLHRDPFVSRLHLAWQKQGQIPFDVNSWVKTLFRQNYSSAAHLWTSIETKIPESFEHEARAAHLYSLWKIGVSQTFVNEWLAALRLPEFRTSSIAQALHERIRPGFGDWLKTEGIAFTEDQAKLIAELFQAQPTHSLYLTLQAKILEHEGLLAQPVLEKLPAHHASTIPLANTLILAHARRGELAQAARVIKNHLEPAIRAQKDEQAFIAHQLQLARLLYQAGSLGAAEAYYLKVPNTHPDFFQAREELTWVRLRMGDRQKLRGDVHTLGSSVFEEIFSPEHHAVRAISNLKLCHYQAVAEDFNRFRSIYTPVAKSIQKALKAQDPPRPQRLDERAKEWELALQKRTQESAQLARLAEESVTAILPAVGPQSHWIRYQKSVQARSEQIKKLRTEAYRRIWKNQYLTLNEAIRKMRFIRVELLSQVKSLAALQKENSGRAGSAEDQLRLSQAQTLQAEPAGLKTESNDWVFPVDGVVWPDEFFRLQGLTEGSCLQAVGQ